uniref:Uncharacterized protein n=1 Tax=Cacopsylla melanoneura TaxID=428564 RepID=A0A8D8WUF3_9HEMI
MPSSLILTNRNTHLPEILIVSIDSLYLEYSIIFSLALSTPWSFHNLTYESMIFSLDVCFLAVSCSSTKHSKGIRFRFFLHCSTSFFFSPSITCFTISKVLAKLYQVAISK